MGNIKKFIKGYKEGQKLFGETIAVVINSFLLLLVYIIGVGFTWLFSLIFNKRFLDKHLDLDKETYWENLNLSKMKKEEYYKQY